MPRIPDVTAFGARPALPAQTFAMPQADTAGLRANEELSRALVKTGQQIDEADARTELESYRSQLNQWELDNIYSDETGIKNFKGSDAFALPGQMQKNFDDFAAKQLQTLRNGRARQAAAAMTDARRVNMLGTVNEYVHGQRETYRTDQFNASVSTSLQRMQADPSTADLERAHLQMATVARLRDVGAPKEQVDAALSEVNAKSYGAVLDGMLARNELSNAVGFFNQHQNDLGDKQGHYASLVKEAKFTVAKTQYADEIIGKYGTGSAAYEAAKKIDDPIVRDGVEREIDQEDARRNRLRSDGERSVRESAYGKLEGSALGASLESIYSPHELLAINRQPGLREALEHRALDRVTGKEVRTDFATWESARQDILAGKPVDLTSPEYQRRISTGDLKGLADLQNPSKLAVARIDQDDFNKIADGAGLHPFAARTEDQKRSLGELKAAVEQRINVEQQSRGGKELTRDEKQAIAQQEIDNKVIKSNALLSDRLFPNDPVPAALLPADQFSKAYVNVDGKQVYLSKIPADWRGQIINRLRQANRPVTEQAIAEVWVKAGSPTQ